MEFVISYADTGCFFSSELEFPSINFRQTLFYCAVDFSSSLPISQKRERLQTKSYDCSNAFKVFLLFGYKRFLYVSCN